MAINLNVDNMLRHETEREVDIENLKLRLALEGATVIAPIYGDLIQIHHPQHGTTHFNSWGTVLDHCNQNWIQTYWGPTYHGAPIQYDSSLSDNKILFINREHSHT